MFNGQIAPPRPEYIEGSVVSVLGDLQADYGFAAEDAHLLETVLIAAGHGIATLVNEGRMNRSLVPSAVDMLTTIILQSPKR